MTIGFEDAAGATARRAATARDLLSVDGIDGVNLSGPASTTGEADRLAVMRAVAERLRTPARPIVTASQGPR